MAAVGSMRAGKNSRVTIASTNLRFANWRVTVRGDDLDTTNFESSGAEQGTIGVTVAEWNTGGDWDAGINPYDAPPGLYPRDDLGAVRFYENVTDNIFHSYLTNRVISAENGAEVKGKVTFSATGKSQGCVLVGTSLPAGDA